MSLWVTSAATRWLSRHRFLSVGVEFKIDPVKAPGAVSSHVRIPIGTVGHFGYRIAYSHLVKKFLVILENMFQHEIF
ncbi:MAG: hypothetical protein OEQ39_06665, partial [Gammaproteobacteria bacterium]|nr:hypothetical protein [Gammaproteobacteria bacterium]